jgi:hypothetical protein
MRFFKTVDWIWIASVLATSGLALSGCSSGEVRSESAPGLTLNQIRTYDWASPQMLEQPDTFTSRRDDILDRQIKNQVDNYLQKQGLTPNHVNPDVRIAYSVRTQMQTQVEPGFYPEPFFYYWADEPADRVIEKNKGTVDLDFLDRSGKVVWRGVAVTDVAETGESGAQVKEALNNILEALPGSTKTS